MFYIPLLSGKTPLFPSGTLGAITLEWVILGGATKREAVSWLSYRAAAEKEYIPDTVRSSITLGEIDTVWRRREDGTS